MSGIEKKSHALQKEANALGNLLVEIFHYLSLFIIGAVVVWAFVVELIDIIGTHNTTIEGVLLLFIYLELISMVGIYFKTRQLPIRFLLYVSITAMTRHLIGIISHPDDAGVSLLYLCGSVFLLALSVVAIRFASHKYPTSLDPNGTER